jgi:hypothetical protein
MAADRPQLLPSWVNHYMLGRGRELLIVATPNSYSLRNCSNNSTLGLLFTKALLAYSRMLEFRFLVLQATLSKFDQFLRV